MNKQVMDIFKKSKESLIAEEVHQKNISELWAIVCSYYSMYYCKCSSLKLGYKVGEKIVHKVTSINNCLCRGKLKGSLIEGYEDSKKKH